jgi:hypothetical protein
MARRTHYEAPRYLDNELASQVLAPVVRRALDNVVEGAKRHAPPVGVWITARDERVRRSHVDTDGQAVPANLRFVLPKAGNQAGTDLAKAPRDPDLPIANRANCRCGVAEIPQLLADSIHAGPVQVTGTVVRAEAYTKFPRAGEAEVGNTSGDEGARFMRKGLEEAAARMREAAAR